MKDWAKWALDTAAARGASYLTRRAPPALLLLSWVAFCACINAHAVARDRIHLLKFESITAGGNHTCALSPDGHVYCWGSNKDGQLGIGAADEDPHPTPLRVSGELKFRSVDAGRNHTCGLTDRGLAYCWGENKHGQLGNGTLNSVVSPEPVSGDLTWRSLSAGSTHTCGIATSGAAYCWGGNWHGQLGMGTLNGDERYPCCHTLPVRVTGRLGFSSIQAAGIHTCGLTTAGEAFCWGNHKNFGQLGTGDSDLVDSPAPLPVVGGHKFVSLSAGLPSCGIVASRAVYCWGGGSVPELGIKSTVERLESPVLLSSDIVFENVAAGSFFACGVASGGRLYCWGYNRYGQVGDGSTADAEFPQLVSPELRFRRVSAGGDDFSGHACGITNDGRTFCWGDNRHGQLGDGSTVGRPRPVAVLQPAEQQQGQG